MPAVLSHRLVVTDRSPILRETVYDRVVAALWAIFWALTLFSGVLIAIWCCLSTPDIATDNDIIGSLPESIVEVQEPVVVDVPAVQMPDQDSDPPHAQLPLVDIADQIAAMTSSVAIESAGSVSQPSTSEFSGQLSTGNRPIGVARPLKHVRRWVIEVDAPRSLAGYAALLRRTGIMPAAVYPDGRIESLDLSGESPSAKSLRERDVEDRFYTRWNQGDLQQLDHQMFSAAGVDLTDAVLVHFFSAGTERMLQQRALEFAGRGEHEISRTWFRLAGTQSGFEFEVVRQTGR